ncbi:ThiJ/PfpI family protein [Dacryopinax primogenitus]|uniref:D-lactate dehydratase n=1 Tax=Dacryopinax primogenitus (strain DJM 731) TaxID=1858805 RepID=M5G7D7_DACPD|nr:ThiJ/PfpI family protein [Dacryopinax primogenitus]EJU04644.1 ThiJ/PfpI family protein [Dacryopinax primogenitus]
METEAPAEPTGTILVVLSDASSPLERKDGDVVHEETATFVAELAKPLEQLLDAGYEVTFASPSGRKPSLSPLSNSLLSHLLAYYARKPTLSQLQKQRAESALASPRSFASVTDEEVDNFEGVFVPGGKTPMMELGEDAELGRLLWGFHNLGKPTAALYHGVYALLSTLHASEYSGFAYPGYRITTFSNPDEKSNAPNSGPLISNMEDALKAAGATLVSEKDQREMGEITHDRELVTAGNFTGAKTLAEEFLEMLTGGY